MALRFYPDTYPEGVCTNATCDAEGCSKVLVDAGMLTADAAPDDRQEAALIDAIARSAPSTENQQSGGTPTYAALDGALRWASAYQTSHQDQKAVVVFVTDGFPVGCDDDTRRISQLAADALAASSVVTHSIGLADYCSEASSWYYDDEVALPAPPIALCSAKIHGCCSVAGGCAVVAAALAGHGQTGRNGVDFALRELGIVGELESSN